MSILGKALSGRISAKAPVPLVSARGSSGGGAGGGASAPDVLARMGTVGTLFSIVNRTSTATASTDWEFYRVPSDGRRDPGEDREPVTAHAALDLWNRPNPFMTTGQLVEVGQQHLDLVGECVMVVSKAGSIPIELWPVRPDRISPVPHPTEFLSGWIYRDPDGNKIPLKTDEVIFLRMPNPMDPYRGLGPVQSILSDLDSVKYSAEWNRNFFLNSAEPGGIIEVDRRLGDDEFEEMTMRWNEQHRGVSRAHRVAVIEQGKYVPRAFSMRDMQFAELRAVGRDTIMEAYGISRATLGITDGVNYAAAKAARTQFAELLTVPRLNRWREALNHQLLPMFEPQRKPGARVIRTVEFDYASPVEDDPEQVNAERESKATAAKIYIEAGFNPVSVQETLGLPDMVYGNGEDADPDRDLLVQLVTGAPTLAPLILPMLGFELPEQAPQLGPDGQPVDPNAPPELGPDGKPVKPDPNADPNAKPPAPGDPKPPAKPPAKGKDAPPVPAKAVHNALDDDLAELAAAWDKAKVSALRQWEDVRADWRTSLRKQVKTLVKAGDLAGLASLSVDPAKGAKVLRKLIGDVSDHAYAGVVRDAALEDVKIPARAAGVRIADESGDIASIVAGLLAAQISVTAGQEAARQARPGRSADEVADVVDQFLAQQSGSSTETAVGAALHGAQNKGRRDAFAAGPVGSLYASERLDGNTCAQCRAIDGRYICTTDDLGPYDRLYTAMGGYVDCAGGIRCRGVVTGVWRPKQHAGAPPLAPEPRTVPVPRSTLDAWAGDVDRIAKIVQPADRDAMLAEIWRIQGFDGPPQLVSAAAFAALGEDAEVLYRGIAGEQAADWIEQLRTGALFAGLGAYGNGIYTTTDAAAAAGYAAGRGWRGATVDGAVVRMALRPGARVIDLEDLRVLVSQDERFEKPGYGTAFGDLGRAAAALGYDAIRVTPDRSAAERYYVVLNRTALIMEEGS